MERQIMCLSQKALDAAEAAAANDGGSDESRCIELLKTLKDSPIPVDVLLSTQVDKRLRHLKKHQREKIRLMAAWLMEVWSKKIKDDRSSSRNKGGKGIITSDHDDLLLFASSSVQKHHQSSGNKRKLETCGMVSARKRFSCDSRNVSVGHQKEEKVFSCFKKPLQERPRVSKENDTTPFRCLDDSRNKIREILVEAFSRVSSEVSHDSEEVKERVRGCDPVDVAVSVECVMFKKMGLFNGAKKLKYRSIMFNLKDPKNPDLRRKILLGDIKPEMLINMTSEEMASHQMQCKNHQIKQKILSGLIKKPLEDTLAKSDADEAVRIHSL